MFFFSVALASLSHRLTALPVDRLVAWCLFLGTLMISCGTVLLLSQLVRGEARQIANGRRR